MFGLRQRWRKEGREGQQTGSRGKDSDRVWVAADCVIRSAS